MRVDTSAVRRALIIKLSAMGDIVHALPVSAALADAFPQWELTWAVEEPFAPLVTGNPYLTDVITLPKLGQGRLRSADFRREYAGLLREIRRRKFDLTLDLQGLTKSAALALASGARYRLGYHWLREAAPLVERAVPHRPDSVHIVEQYLDVARALGAEPRAPRFPFDIPREDAAAVANLLREAGLSPEEPFVSINPASALAIKQWGASKYAQLIDVLFARLGLRVVLVTADRSVGAQVQSLAEVNFANLTGQTNLKQLADVLRRSAVHVCGDTGSGHLASALGRPVVALFGPTDPERASPYGQRANVLSHRAACGQACDWHRCEFASPRCLDAISVEEALARVACNVTSSPRPILRDGPILTATKRGAQVEVE